MVDLDEDENEKITIAAIKGKDFKIKEHQTNLNKAKYVINFLEQENEQLKTKRAIDEVKYIIAQREEEKAKAMLDETLEKYAFLDEKSE